MKTQLPSLWSSRFSLDPFSDMRREFDTLFGRAGRWANDRSAGETVPAVNVSETADAVEITAELPGVAEKDISIELDGPRLVISGEKKAESTSEDKNWRVVERSYGAFQRTVLLPFQPDQQACEAHVDKGVLHVRIARPKNATANKRIEVKSATPEAASQAPPTSTPSKAA